mgnify:CR=1 FL=1
MRMSGKKLNKEQLIQRQASIKQTLKTGAVRASKIKSDLLARGGYAPIPHAICRDILPELKEKYDGQTARDALFLFFFLSSYVNGSSDNDAFMWAFPNVEQIVSSTGIHKDRVKKLVDILISEGLLETTMIIYHGKSKKMYLPLPPVTEEKSPPEGRPLNSIIN